MRLIHTNFIQDQIEVPINTCRVYQTNCNDDYFTDIIDVNREILEDQFIPTNHLYVIMENEHIEEVRNYYGSISYAVQQVNSSVLITICIITLDNISNGHDLLRKLLFQSLEHLSFYYDNPRLQLSMEEQILLNSEVRLNYAVNRILALIN